MKKIRKTLAGIVALSMFVSNAVYISAAEEVKNDAGSQTASEDAAGSSAEAKYTKELAEIMANADMDADGCISVSEFNAVKRIMYRGPRNTSMK